jgi:hypothetical protein
MDEWSERPGSEIIHASLQDAGETVSGRTG